MLADPLEVAAVGANQYEPPDYPGWQRRKLLMDSGGATSFVADEDAIAHVQEAAVPTAERGKSCSTASGAKVYQTGAKKH